MELDKILRDSTLVAELMEYKRRRANDPRGEYFSFFAAKFGGKERGRTAKLEAVDTLIYYIQEGQLHAGKTLPKAAQNGELAAIVNRFFEAEGVGHSPTI